MDVSVSTSGRENEIVNMLIQISSFIPTRTCSYDQLEHTPHPFGTRESFAESQ